MYKTVHEAVVFVKEFRSLVKDVDGRRDRASRRRSRRCTRSPKRRGTRTSASPARTCTGSARARSPARSAPAMLKEAGAEYVIIGHSERRRLFGETDETVNRKLVAALGAQLTPIVCIGETLEEREARTRRWPCSIARSRTGLDGLTGGSGRRAGHRLRAGLGDRHRTQRDAGAGRRGARAHPRAAAAVVRRRRRPTHCHVIYGGSVKPDNIHELIVLPDVDGALVGGASLDVRGFADIVSRSQRSAV